MTIITLKGTPMHTLGTLPAVGTQATDFTVTKVDLSEIKLKNYLGKKIILNIFPSLDTSTCATAMLRFNKIATQYKNTLILCVSADLPFAQQRFCAAQHIENVVPVSVFRHPKFAESYGVLITDGPLAGLLSRAVIIIIYAEQVMEISEEPQYDNILDTLAAHDASPVRQTMMMLEEWKRNDAFRVAFRKNPNAAIKQYGFHCSTEELAEFEAMVRCETSQHE